MKSYLPAAAFGIALTAAAFGFGAATANASSNYTNESASMAASDLRMQGYAVQINGSTNGADLSMCTVTGVEGLSARAFGTAYIDVSCPSSNT